MDNENQGQNQNTDPDKETSLKDRVMGSVKSGRLKMRPKWHFVLQASLLAVGTVVVSLALVYMASLFLFIFRETGIWMAPAFGWHGIIVFLFSLPWLLILLVLLFIVILEILVRHYAFAYRMPLIYSGLAIIFLVGVGGLLVIVTPFHEKMADCPEEGGPPPCRMGFYRDLDPDRHQNLHEGTIVQISGRNYTIVNRRQEQLLIVVTPETRLPFGTSFAEGDKIVVIGEREGFQVNAFGISPFDGRRPDFEP